MKTLVALLVLLLTVGCATFSEEHHKTILMDRNTGELKDCVVDKWRSKESYEKYHACVKDYEAQGYTIWSQY